MQNRIDLTDSVTRVDAADCALSWADAAAGCARSPIDDRGCPAGAVAGPEVPFRTPDSDEGKGGALVVAAVVSVVVIVVAAVAVMVVDAAPFLA